MTIARGFPDYKKCPIFYYTVDNKYLKKNIRRRLDGNSFLGLLKFQKKKLGVGQIYIYGYHNAGNVSGIYLMISDCYSAPIN